MDHECFSNRNYCLGAIPIFSEINLDTLLDPNFIEEKINKKTKAIMAIDIFGQSADYKKINLIAKKYNLRLSPILHKQ